MSRPNLQLVIDRLLGEEAFRRTFLESRITSLRQLREQGVELTESECERLRTTNWTLWLKLIETL